MAPPLDIVVVRRLSLEDPADLTEKRDISVSDAYGLRPWCQYPTPTPHTKHSEHFRFPVFINPLPTEDNDGRDLPMARKKPISTKQKKAHLQEQRAIKRGDLPPEAATFTNSGSAKRGRGRGGRRIGGRSQALLRDDIASDDPAIAAAAANAARKIESTRRLQSSFLRLSPEFLAASKERASNEALPRPIPFETRYFPTKLVNQQAALELTCPKRPKWKYEQTKKEVEKNEEGLFAKWMVETQTKVDQWQSDLNKDQNDPSKTNHLASPTYYEHNLEVWRQLWRVTELSSILLVLVDSRCPPLHYPPSLHAYLSNLQPRRQIIIVLTKVDVTGQELADRWKLWLHKQHPGVRVVQVESYKPKIRENKGQGSRVQQVPHIPPQFLDGLINALRSAHEDLLQPPEYIQGDPDKLAHWTPRVMGDVDWNIVAGQSVPGDEPSAATLDSQDTSPPDALAVSGTEIAREDGSANEPLTIGLIGQPNVGKSSLLNALFGEIRVRASRTPGKTKHFQTLFWSPQIRLVDCPGLVLPNLTPMELQVLCSILPISQIPSMPACISYASALLPLEIIFGLTHPSEKEEKVEDKRTWRDSTVRLILQDKTQRWTAMDIMTAYALKKGWVTAKAGRPDVNRAGNAILRALAESKVKWAFEPSPDNSETTPDSAGNNGYGIWRGVSNDEDEEAVSDSDSKSGDEEESAQETKGQPELEPSGTEEEADVIVPSGGGMFGALIEDAEEDEDDESDEDRAGSDVEVGH